MSSSTPVTGQTGSAGDLIIDQFLDDATTFGAVVDAGGNWSAPSPCEGWSALDVLDHVIETERDLLASHEVPLGPAPTGEPAERWAAQLAELRRVLTADVVGRPFEGVFGPTTVGATLRDYYGFDLLVHRWDLGTALGQQVVFSDEELDRIEALTARAGEPLYTYGACKRPLPVPDGASRLTAVLARLGRAG